MSLLPSRVRRAGRRPAILALAAGLGATASIALGIMTAPAAHAADTVLVPPAATWTPDRTGGPAPQGCGGSVRCVGPGAAYATIQAAVDAAADGDTIQVQAGTYDEHVLIDGKQLTLLGGFAAGFGSRNPVTNVTTIDGQGAGGSTVHWIKPGASTLDGFRITGGKATLNEFQQGYGSGVWIDTQDQAGLMTVRHNLIEGNDDGQNFNSAACGGRCVFGGGIAFSQWQPGSSALLSDNIIRNNKAVMAAGISSEIPITIERNLIENNIAGGDHGGGFFLSADGTVLRQNLIKGNKIGTQAGYGWGGGGIFTGNDSTTRPLATLEANRWTGNEAPLHGSGFFADEASRVTIVGDIFHDNVCHDDAAGIYLDGGTDHGTSATIENVTIAHNSCPAGNKGTGIMMEGGSRMTMTNSIVTGNGGDSDIWQCDNCQTTPAASPSTVSYSLVGPKTGSVTYGTGMVAGSPSFVNAAGGDFHLAASSPAIDAADPASTVGAEPAPNGSRRNVGAYGGSAEATTTGGGGGGGLATPVITPTWPTGLTVGTASSVTVSVSGDGTAATGSVKLSDGATQVSTATLAGGSATLPIPANALTAGAHTLRVDYLGSATIDAGFVTHDVTVATGGGGGDPTPGLPVPTSDVWNGSCDSTATGHTYEVGPGQALTSIGAVPWLSLGPGDRVDIHARPTAYKEKILVVGQGTASAPITICGVPDASGNRPVIDGNGATTRPGMVSDYEATQERGVITLAAPDNSPYGTKPKYVVIDGLKIVGGDPGNTFTNWNGVTKTYPHNVAGIFVERGEYVTVRDNEITDDANGLFVGSGNEEESTSRHILVDGNYFHGNGVADSFQEHNSYVAGIDSVFQFNHYGPLRAGALGGSLKDRSAGTVVRYNYIDGGSRGVDLVDAEDSYAIVGGLPEYRQTWVYGNFFETTQANGQLVGPKYPVHYGGDSGTTTEYRKGTLYFFNNTVSYRVDQSVEWDCAVFDLSTADEKAEIWNNAFYAAPATPGQTPIALFMARESGTLHLGANVTTPGTGDWRVAEHTGAITGMDNLVPAPGNDFGFTAAATGDFRPTTSSFLVDKGVAAPVTIPAKYQLKFEYVEHMVALGRPVNGAATDMGAYEAGIGLPVTSGGGGGGGGGGGSATVTPDWPASLRYGAGGSIDVSVTTDGAAATGSVELRDGGTTIDTATLAGGSATLAVGPTDLTPGSHTLVVAYLDPGGTEQGTASQDVAVQKARPDQPYYVIKRGRVTVWVNGPDGLPRPTGTVQIKLTKRGAKPKTVSGTLSGGTTKITLPNLSRGTWHLKVTYLGDDLYASAASYPGTIRVT